MCVCVCVCVCVYFSRHFLKVKLGIFASSHSSSESQ